MRGSTVVCWIGELGMELRDPKQWVRPRQEKNIIRERVPEDDVYKSREAGRVLLVNPNRVGIPFHQTIMPHKVTPLFVYFVKARMIFAEIWRKNIDAMKERERTRTMNGSLWERTALSASGKQKKRKEWRRTRTLEALASRPCTA